MQGIPENSTLMSLSRSVLPAGVLGGELPGAPMNSGASESPKKSSKIFDDIDYKDGSPKKNENGIQPSKEHVRHRRFTSFKVKEEVSANDAAAKLVKKNRMIARLDIVCLILFPIIFLLYAAIYLMTTAL